MKTLLQLGVCEKLTSRPLNKSKITNIHDHPYYNGLEESTSRAPESCTTVNILRFLSPFLWLKSKVVNLICITLKEEGRNRP